jgi:AAA+ superfamily predicted ATPase
MGNNPHLNILKEKFERLKNECIYYNDCHKKDALDFNRLPSITQNIIVPTLSIDVDEGAAMWQYMLDYYYKRLPNDDMLYRITGEVVDEVEYSALVQVFSKYDDICDYAFRISTSTYLLHERWFIRDAVFHNEFNLTNKLIPLVLQNNNGEHDAQWKFFELLDDMIDCGGWYMKSVHIDYVAKWIPLLKDPLQRDEIELKLIKAIDVVENRAPKGPMPFKLFASEGGMEMLAAEKARQSAMKIESGQKDAPKTINSFDEYMEQRKQRIKATEEIEKAEEERITLFDMEELQKCQDELNALIGLDAVKDEVASLINLMQINRIRKERGLVVPNCSKHLVFTGNPGTGKTTIARLLGRIYHALGVLSNGHFVEVDRSGLVAGYVGQTAIKTQEVINKSLGGILFVDEAYSLNVEGSENDYGKEAVETLLKAMEDKRDDFVVIVAGYDDLMDKFIKSNPGLKSRFNKYIHFPDYSSKELMNIFMALIDKNQYKISSSAYILLQEHFDHLAENKGKNFGNGREVRNIFERMISIQANRIVQSHNISNDDLTMFIEDDVKELF